MSAHLARVVGQARLARDLIGRLDGLQVAVQRCLGVHHDRLTCGQIHQQIRAQAAIVAKQRGLRTEVAILQHAGHFHHAAQLNFTPPSARARRAQGRHQLARLAAQLRLRLDQAAHLLAEPGIGSGARLLQFLDLVVHLVERFAHRGHQIGDGLLAQFQIAAGTLLGLGQGGAGQLQEGLAVARQRVGGERLEGVGELLPRVFQQCQFLVRALTFGFQPRL